MNAFQHLLADNYRVALLSTLDIGGAGLAANRLHSGLLQQKVQSTFIASHLRASDAHSYQIRSSKFATPVQSYLNYFLHEHVRPRPKGSYFTSSRGSLSSTQLLQLAKNADIINLHWVAHYLSLEALARLSQISIPVVWTFHDWAPLTGGCMYPQDCSRWRTDCHDCPQLTKYRQYPAAVMQLKKAYFSPHWVLVVLNHWMKAQVQKSAVFAHNRIEVIPNGIDTESYSPLEAKAARQQLGLPQGKPLAAFIAQELSERRKGLPELIAALHQMPAARRPHLITCGSAIPAKQLQGIAHTQLGFLSGTEKLRAFYSAADLTLFPSLEDTFGNVIIESLACGTPVVGFRTGGMPDVISDGKQGYVLAHGDTKALADGIQRVLAGPDLSAQCRQRILDHYPLHRPAERYHALFTELVERYRARPPVPMPHRPIPATFPSLKAQLPFHSALLPTLWIYKLIIRKLIVIGALVAKNAKELILHHVFFLQKLTRLSAMKAREEQGEGNDGH